MMALSVPNPPTTPRRVKVYELRNNDWFDRGTGYCTGQLVNVREPSFWAFFIFFTGANIRGLLVDTCFVLTSQLLDLFSRSLGYSVEWAVVILWGYRWLMLVARCVVG